MIKEDDLKKLQAVVDELVEKHKDKLLISIVIAVMDKDFNPGSIELLQFGLRDCLKIMHRDALEHTSNEPDEFIASKHKTIH